MKIKKLDNVLVTTGKDRGKTGVVEKAMPKINKVVITGVNLAKHHLKPTRKNPHGGILDIPAPMNVSNVQIICPHCSKASRVAYQVTESGKERICRKCKGNLDSGIKTPKVKTTLKEKNVKA